MYYLEFRRHKNGVHSVSKFRSSKDITDFLFRDHIASYHASSSGLSFVQSKMSDIFASCNEDVIYSDAFPYEIASINANIFEVNISAAEYAYLLNYHRFEYYDQLFNLHDYRFVNRYLQPIHISRVARPYFNPQNLVFDQDKLKINLIFYLITVISFFPIFFVYEFFYYFLVNIVFYKSFSVSESRVYKTFSRIGRFVKFLDYCFFSLVEFVLEAFFWFFKPLYIFGGLLYAFFLYVFYRIKLFIWRLRLKHGIGFFRGLFITRVFFGFFFGIFKLVFDFFYVRFKAVFDFFEDLDKAFSRDFFNFRLLVVRVFYLPIFFIFHMLLNCFIIIYFIFYTFFKLVYFIFYTFFKLVYFIFSSVRNLSFSPIFDFGKSFFYSFYSYCGFFFKAFYHWIVVPIGYVLSFFLLYTYRFLDVFPIMWLFRFLFHIFVIIPFVFLKIFFFVPVIAIVFGKFCQFLLILVYFFTDFLYFRHYEFFWHFGYLFFLFYMCSGSVHSREFFFKSRRDLLGYKLDMYGQHDPNFPIPMGEHDSSDYRDPSLKFNPETWQWTRSTEDIIDRFYERVFGFQHADQPKDFRDKMLEEAARRLNIPMEKFRALPYAIQQELFEHEAKRSAYRKMRKELRYRMRHDMHVTKETVRAFTAYADLLHKTGAYHLRTPGMRFEDSLRYSEMSVADVKDYYSKEYVQDEAISSDKKMQSDLAYSEARTVYTSQLPYGFRPSRFYSFLNGKDSLEDKYSYDPFLVLAYKPFYGHINSLSEVFAISNVFSFGFSGLELCHYYYTPVPIEIPKVVDHVAAELYRGNEPRLTVDVFKYQFNYDLLSKDYLKRILYLRSTYLNSLTSKYCFVDTLSSKFFGNFVSNYYDYISDKISFISHSKEFKFFNTPAIKLSLNPGVNQLKAVFNTDDFHDLCRFLDYPALRSSDFFKDFESYLSVYRGFLHVYKSEVLENFFYAAPFKRFGQITYSEVLKRRYPIFDSNINSDVFRRIDVYLKDKIAESELKVAERPYKQGQISWLAYSDQLYYMGLSNYRVKQMLTTAYQNFAEAEIFEQIFNSRSLYKDKRYYVATSYPTRHTFTSESVPLAIIEFFFVSSYTMFYLYELQLTVLFSASFSAIFDPYLIPWAIMRYDNVFMGRPFYVDGHFSGPEISQVRAPLFWFFERLREFVGAHPLYTPATGSSQSMRSAFKNSYASMSLYDIGSVFSEDLGWELEGDETNEFYQPMDWPNYYAVNHPHIITGRDDFRYEALTGKLNEDSMNRGTADFQDFVPLTYADYRGRKFLLELEEQPLTTAYNYIPEWYFRQTGT